MDNIKCIKCGKLLTPHYLDNTDSDNPLIQIWDGGSVNCISFSYGSKLDGDSFIIALCDECTTKLHEEKIIKKYE